MSKIYGYARVSTKNQNEDRQMDGSHLNARGSYLYTSLLGQVMSGTEEEKKKYFCDSYKEKLSLEEPQIFGLYWKDGADETMRYVTIVARMQESHEVIGTLEIPFESI